MKQSHSALVSLDIPKGRKRQRRRNTGGQVSDTALRQEKHGNVRLVVFETAPPLAPIRSHAAPRCVACFCNSALSVS